MNYKGKIIKSLQIANLLFFSPNFDLYCMIIVTSIFKKLVNCWEIICILQKVWLDFIYS